MSEIGIGRRANAGAFNPGTMLLIVAVGILAFMAMLLLGAYAPDMKSGKDGGPHALSNAATGYSGLVQLAEATGREPRIVRSPDALDSEALVVLTPPAAAVSLGDVLQRRTGKATLVVLPKWATQEDEQRPGWVRAHGLLPVYEPQGILAPAYPLVVRRAKGVPERLLETVPGHAPETMRFREPHVIQGVAGQVTPIVTDGSGRILVGEIRSGLYVLADPDLLNNRGMADARQAASALALLDFLNSTDAEEILFDVTLNGLGRSRSPLKLAFDPPFLAVTVAIFAALLLAGLQGIARFGAPLRPVRAIAFGKRALVDNSAALIKRAGREKRLGGRYADVIRERARLLFGLSAAAPATDEQLDKLNPRAPFAPLAAAASEARGRKELTERAKALHQWLEEAKA